MRNNPFRGFQHLIGETIKKVDAGTINVVRFETTSGKIIEVDADDSHCGIGIIQCSDVTDKEQ